MKNILNNKFIKFIFGLIKALIWIAVILIVLIIFVQRIFNNKISIGSYRMFVVVTGSMLPEYKINDVIISKEIDPSKIEIGNDVVYKGKKDSYKDKIIVHRVIKRKKIGNKYTFITKGIANPAEDPLITEDQVYGVVTYRPKILSTLSHILNNSYGLYFLIFVPTALLLFFEILDKIKEKEEENETE